MSRPIPAITSRPGVTGRHSLSIELCVQYTLENPMASDEVIGKLIGRTPMFVMQMRKADMFKAILAKRIEEKYGASKARLRHQLVRVAEQALDAVSEAIHANKLSPSELIDVIKELVPHTMVQASHIAPGVSIHLGSNVPQDILVAARARSHEHAQSVEVISDTMKEHSDDLPDQPTARRARVDDAILMEEDEGERGVEAEWDSLSGSCDEGPAEEV